MKTATTKKINKKKSYSIYKNVILFMIMEGWSKLISTPHTHTHTPSFKPFKSSVKTHSCSSVWIETEPLLFIYPLPRWIMELHWWFAPPFYSYTPLAQGELTQSTLNLTLSSLHGTNSPELKISPFINSEPEFVGTGPRLLHCLFTSPSSKSRIILFRCNSTNQSAFQSSRFTPLHRSRTLTFPEKGGFE